MSLGHRLDEKLIKSIVKKKEQVVCVRERESGGVSFLKCVHGIFSAFIVRQSLWFVEYLCMLCVYAADEGRQRKREKESHQAGSGHPF